ncbi:MAG: hypothetical protein CFE30_27475 [Bradyrhizobium sp. PARBB1]|nr:MAG: hypothetical protein CFE30_27475 [Bradyrhizobium sp. PARBB1]PSO26242.1 hypothetical protein C7G43_13470 [Bradyrhizobium sp. MOS004]HAQ82668.1 hypothetical protein [Bradyrhizobium sp.]HAR18397.1 hypothetical protein [Bradyrhizobium sp.]HAR28652.1 hypothetical protein [Bradyrhizobium sp.]
MMLQHGEDPMANYTGDRTIDGISVLVDGAPLSPHYDQLRLTEHGFEWSYEGPEPAQLAFALLYDHLHDATVAKALYESFMRRIVANFDNEWELSSADLDEAVAALRSGQTA